MFFFSIIQKILGNVKKEKTEIISDWEVAQKHLNVCSANTSAENCSNGLVCGKCLRALITLDAMGKLDKFAGVFDIDKYRKMSEAIKCLVVLNRNKDTFYADLYNFAVNIKTDHYQLCFTLHSPKRKTADDCHSFWRWRSMLRTISMSTNAFLCGR